ncbi:H-NS family nucleoid-associated regulatory protein [Muricoccus roseus]
MKFRGPNGEAWSGRGRLPKWLQVAEAKGRKKKEVLVET